MAEMQTDNYPLPDTLTVARRLFTKLDAEFREFDTMVPRSGRLHPEDLSDSQHKVIMRFDVAGWDNDGPHEYVVRIEMDWNSLSHYFPLIDGMYPSSKRVMVYNVYGQAGVMKDVMDSPESLSRKRLLKALPQETNALLFDHQLDLAQMGRLVHELLVMQIERTPEYVGYPVTIIKIPAGGRATQQSYNK